MSGARSSKSPPRLIVGLGNPGAEYTRTRHNAGFWFCERLAARLQVTLAHENRFFGITGQARASGIRLLLPQTFMNRSGQAIGALARFYRIAPEEILIVHDELDLPPGQMRLKFGGGLGGHNGLKDASAHLSTHDYWRLRIGIGHPGDRNQVIHYVLKPPAREDLEPIEHALDRALAAWPAIEAGDWDAATRQINARPPANKTTPATAK